MTKQDKVAAVNAVINGERGEYARGKGANAYIREDGKLIYTDSAHGYVRRISFAELCRYIHGEDIRALRAAF